MRKETKTEGEHDDQTEAKWKWKMYQAKITRVYLKETAVVEELADVLNDLGAGLERLGGVLIHQEVKVTVAIARFHLRQGL